MVRALLTVEEVERGLPPGSPIRAPEILADLERRGVAERVGDRWRLTERADRDLGRALRASDPREDADRAA